ncbi:MAG: GNAT family N-acetyltransferase, partial [Clostridia bacterium]|nr:GNAT family N-acetyltransferase [Clostridia bacterium]
MKHISLLVSTPQNKPLADACTLIAESHHKKNGGPLQFEGLVYDSDILLSAMDGELVTGFLCFKTYPVFENGLYVELIAVAKDCLRQKIGTFLLNRAVEYGKEHGYDCLYANVRKNNTPSQRLFRSAGFVPYDMPVEHCLALGFSREEIRSNDGFRFR